MFLWVFLKNLWDKGSEIYYREIVKKNSLPFSQIKNQLEILSKKYVLYVVSATSLEEVESKFDQNQLSKYFKDVYALNKIGNGFSKINTIKNIIEKEGINKDEIIYIGDMNVDFESSKEAGLKNIIILDYGWGNTITEDQTIKVKKQENLLDAIESFN